MIGLLTFHNSNNFGSLLQTYGLYRKVTELGFDCEVIDYRCDAHERSQVPHLPKLRKNLYLYIVNWLRNPLRLKYNSLQKFLRTQMKVSSKCDKKSISKLTNKYSQILVGSDLVWDMSIQDGDLTYFLDFESSGLKKIAFASSIGFPWEEKDKLIIKPLLGEFRHIAVRESLSADWVEELIGKRPPVVCDPTLLLTKDEWMTFVKPDDHPEKYVLVYFETDNNDCINTAIAYARKHNLKVKRIEYGLSTEYERVLPYSINDFLSLIYNAELIVTASYHGILFSLYFNKPLIYFLRRQTSRVDTLVEKLGIGECNGHKMKNRTNLPMMDYDKINQAIDAYRIFSVNCLKKELTV